MSKERSPETLWLEHAFQQTPLIMLVFKKWLGSSSSIEPTLIQKVMYAMTGSCCTLTMELSLYLFSGFSWLFFYHSNFHVQCGLSFPLVAKFRDVGCSLELLNNISNCSHRIFKLFGDVLVAFTFTMLDNYCLLHLVRQLSLFSSRPIVQYVECNGTMQHNQDFSPFKWCERLILKHLWY